MVILPYQTTLGRLFKPDDYARAIRRAEISLSLPPMQTVSNETLLDTGYVTPREEHEDIPNFAHIINLGNDSSPLLVVDGRQYMRYDERTGITRLIAANDWQLQCVRVALTLKLMETRIDMRGSELFLESKNEQMDAFWQKMLAIQEKTDTINENILLKDM